MSLFIDEHRSVFGVEPICRALAVAPSTYYAVEARQAAPSARTGRDAWLLEQIRRVHGQTKAYMAPGKCGGNCVGRASRRPAARSSGCCAGTACRASSEANDAARRSPTTAPSGRSIGLTRRCSAQHRDVRRGAFATHSNVESLDALVSPDARWTRARDADRPSVSAGTSVETGRLP